MKVARYKYEGKESYGVLQSGRLLSLPKLAKRFEADLPSSLEAFIADQNAGKKVEALLAKVKSDKADADLRAVG